MFEETATVNAKALRHCAGEYSAAGDALSSCLAFGHLIFQVQTSKPGCQYDTGLQIGEPYQEPWTTTLVKESALLIRCETSQRARRSSLLLSCATRRLRQWTDVAPHFVAVPDAR